MRGRQRETQRKTAGQVKRGIDRHLSCCPRPLETDRETEREREAVGGAKGETERGAEGKVERERHRGKSEREERERERGEESGRE